MSYTNDYVYLERYAEVILVVGLDFQRGQNLMVVSEPYHWRFLQILTEKAYNLGAHMVHVEAEHPRMTQLKLEHAEDPSAIPDWYREKYVSIAQGDWAKLHLSGSEIQELGGDAVKISAMQKAMRHVSQVVNDRCAKAEMSWCTASLPTQQWAGRVFDTEVSEAVEDRLWSVMKRILRLEFADPVAEWRKHSAEIIQRGARLDKMCIKEMHFVGGGTDLKVQLLEGSIWVGGGVFKSSDASRDHIQGDSSAGMFVPNLPTEESFTTPDFRGTEGRAEIVKPVEVMGKTVIGAWFEFKEGKVIEYGAFENKEALDAFFKVCPQARYMGEIALVDISSPIFQSGLSFYSILYDENACSHFALGSSYPMALEGGGEMSKEELMVMGANSSLVHTDFMIGTEDMNIDVVLQNGEQARIMSEGRMVV